MHALRGRRRCRVGGATTALRSTIRAAPRREAEPTLADLVRARTRAAALRRRLAFDVPFGARRPLKSSNTEKHVGHESGSSDARGVVDPTAVGPATFVSRVSCLRFGFVLRVFVLHLLLRDFYLRSPMTT